MYGFSRRYRLPEFGAPDIHSLNHPAFLRTRRRYRRRPPDLQMAGQAPIFRPEMKSYLKDMLLEMATPSALAPRPERPPEMPIGEPPVAPELSYGDYKAQPPSTRLAGIQPSDMSPYEIQEYADEMATQRKAEKAQRLQELYEGELRPAPDVIDLTPTYRHTGMRPTRREVSETTGLRRLRRGRITPEQLAGRRQALWERHPSMLREAPDLERDVGRFAGMLPPELGVARARHKYAMEHPEMLAPKLPRYETTQTFKTPYGTRTRKLIPPPSRLDIEQARARIASEKARTAYYERPPTTTPSALMKLVGEGVLTFEDAQRLARKEEDPDEELIKWQNVLRKTYKGGILGEMGEIMQGQEELNALARRKIAELQGQPTEKRLEEMSVEELERIAGIR